MGKWNIGNNVTKKQKINSAVRTIISNPSFQYSLSADRQATLQYSRSFTLSPISLEINFSAFSIRFSLARRPDFVQSVTERRFAPALKGCLTWSKYQLLSFDQLGFGGDRLFQGKMSSDGFDRLPINQDLNSFDLRKIEGKGVDNGIDRHHLG